ncbi:MAG: tRNA epoxyqueuosine(34) reductase QueG [Pseudomonadales bacterium]|jgi:epoxyqueuosine reductase|nr:tRNA epoxyqueuosine(34) reductase QueG [Pseudomonadales bacterium]
MFSAASTPSTTTAHALDFAALAADIKAWGRELGFQQVGITDLDPGLNAQHLRAWLARDYHGEMHYMQRHAELRRAPENLVPGALRLISLRMDYLSMDTRAVTVLRNPAQAYVARYALGRDYHKLIRKRLEQLARRIHSAVGDFNYRAFVDSGPVLERAFAEKAGLGWIGKNTMLINRRAGSWFFLGELFTDLPLPIDTPSSAHCGTCRACLDTCPTQAFVGPWILDARRCISYLTIELKGAIPLELRPLIGNRVFGCDDCQLCCPWNKFTSATREHDFTPRHALDRAELVTLFNWSEAEFLRYTEGSAIRRTGYEGWLRNLAVGLGNAPRDASVIAALERRLQDPSALVREHVRWALDRHCKSHQESYHA